MDIWRVSPAGGPMEQLATFINQNEEAFDYVVAANDISTSSNEYDRLRAAFDNRAINKANDLGLQNQYRIMQAPVYKRLDELMGKEFRDPVWNAVVRQADEIIKRIESEGYSPGGTSDIAKIAGRRMIESGTQVIDLWTRSPVDRIREHSRHVTVGIRPEDLRRIAVAFNANWDQVADPARLPWEATDPPAVDTRQFVARLAALLVRRAECADPADKLCAYLTEDFADYLARLRAARSEDEALALLAADKPTFKPPGGQKRNWDDKDGVVDFFMMVFAGLGGNGPSQRSGYDNIWPHSSSLEFYYTDAATGLHGYISSDQLRDHYERPLFYTDAIAPLSLANGRADYRRVLEEMRLESGVLWPIPITLDVTEEAAQRLGAYIKRLREGKAWGVRELARLAHRAGPADRLRARRQCRPRRARRCGGRTSPR